MILYDLLTGRRPFLSEDPAELIEQIQKEQPPSPSSLRPDLDPALEQIVLKCLEKDPGDRYGSALDLASDLELWLAGQPIPSRKPSLVRRISRGLRRYPWFTTAGLLVAAAAMLVPLFLHLSDPDRPLRLLQRKLAAGQTVELVGEMGRPAWHLVKAGGVNPREKFKLDREGCFTIDAFDNVCLVELLPDPQLERYRFRGLVQHKINARGGAVGLYINHVQVINGETRHHFYSLLGFAESRENAVRGLEKSVVFMVMHHNEDAAGLEPIHRVELKRSQLPGDFGTWRELSVEVTPDHVSTFLDGVPLIKEVGRARMNNRIDSLRQSVPELELPRYAPRQGLGLYVHSGAASFKSVLVEPLP